MQHLRLAKKLVCVLVLGGLAYIDYAICYIVGYRELHVHRLKPAAVVLWILIGVFQLSVLLYWILLYFRGAGSLAKIDPMNIYGTDPSLLAVPDAFLCDEQGFPFWCSKCQSLKQRRLFHLGDLGYCVPKFDHYCLWIGTAIGRDNLLIFFKFLQFFNGFFIVTLGYVASTTRLALARNHHNTPHYVILYVLSCFWIIMILALFLVLVIYLSKNRTTLDDITVKQARVFERYEKRLKKRNGNTFMMGRVPRKELGVRYVNVAHAGTRAVVSFYVGESPYNLGFRANLINLVFGGNVSHNTALDEQFRFRSALLIFLVPYADLFLGRCPQASNIYGDDFCPTFMASIHQKIANNQFSHASYIQTKFSSTGATSTSPET